MSETERRCLEDREDEVAAYALGALTSAERDHLEAHMADCPACREQLHWLQPAVEALPASVEQISPPPELGPRLMEIVRSEAGPAEPAAGTQRPSLREWLARLLGPVRPALAGLAVLAVLVAGVTGYLAGGATDPRVVDVQAADPGLEAHGTLRVADGHGTLEVRDLPLLSGGEVYQVWVAHDDIVSPSSVFVVDHDRRGSVTIPELPETAEAIMITSEPKGGSVSPRGEPVMTAQLD